MTIDTANCHVTKPGTNVFQELSFGPDEATRLQAVSLKLISATQTLKQQLMDEPSTWIANHHLNQAVAAGIS